jgi:hypothetical protein
MSLNALEFLVIGEVVVFIIFSGEVFRLSVTIGRFIVGNMVCEELYWSGLNPMTWRGVGIVIVPIIIVYWMITVGRVDFIPSISPL